MTFELSDSKVQWKNDLSIRFKLKITGLRTVYAGTFTYETQGTVTKVVLNVTVKETKTPEGDKIEDYNKTLVVFFEDHLYEQVHCKLS